MRVNNAFGLPTLRSKAPSNRLVPAAGGALAIRIVERMMTFGVMVCFARLAGAHEYGYFVYWQAWVQVMALFGRFGNDTLLLRYVSQYRANEQWGSLRGLLKQSTMLAIAISAVAGLVCLVATRSVAGDSMSLAIIAVLCVPFNVLSSLRESAIRALGSPLVGQLPDLLLRPIVLATCALSLYLFSDQVTAEQEMLCSLTSIAAAFIAGVWLLRHRLPQEVRNHRAEFKTPEWASAASSMLFISGMHLLLRQTDVLMLGWLTNAELVGIYSNASRISELSLFGLTAATSIMAPMIASAFAKRDMQKMQEILRVTSIWILVSTSVLSCCLCLSGRYLLSVFGEEYTVGFPVLLILLFSQIVNAVCGPVGYTMTMTGNQKLAAKVIGLAALMNVVLNYFLIPHWGIHGAAIATAASGIVWNTALAYLVWKRLGLKTIALI